MRYVLCFLDCFDLERNFCFLRTDVYVASFSFGANWSCGTLYAGAVVCVSDLGFDEEGAGVVRVKVVESDSVVRDERYGRY